MLNLLLLRHAKSGWDDPDLPDFERPLSKRGTKAAGIMGRYIAENGLKPEQVLCSDSVRTRATFALVAAEFDGEPINASFHSKLYLAAPGVLLDHVRMADKDTSTLMIIAHNPGLHALSLALIGGGDRRGLREMAMKFPTAALAVITFKLSSWGKIRPALGSLKAFKTPRDLD